MLMRWLAPSEDQNLRKKPITDDPLATLTPDGHLSSNGQIYSVSRINPLYQNGFGAFDPSSSSGYGDSLKSAVLRSTALEPIPEGYVVPKPIWPIQQPLDTIREILMDLLDTMSNPSLTPDQLLAVINHRLSDSVEILKLATEDEIQRLYVNLRNCKRLNHVLKCKPSPTASSSGCSSSSEVQNTNFDKPSVWEQYYGAARANPPVAATGPAAKPTDVPIFPGGGRPEADFTLDVPRSELLTRKMRSDKRWRCRCRLLTTFLGLIFFLLTVMAVSLMLSKGKRMFGSMM